MTGSLLGEGCHIIIPFRTIDPFRTQQIGTCALPASGDGGSVEVDKQMVTGSTFQQVLTVVHVHLVVAREEVYLHACHTNLLAPGKLLLTVLGLVQAVFGCRGSVYPAHAGVVPYHGLHTLRFRVGHRVLHGLAVLHGVPFGIDEHVGEFQTLGHVGISLDDVVVVAAVVVGPVDPGGHTRLDPAGVGYL